MSVDAYSKEMLPTMSNTKALCSLMLQLHVHLALQPACCFLVTTVSLIPPTDDVKRAQLYVTWCGSWNPTQARGQ